MKKIKMRECVCIYIYDYNKTGEVRVGTFLIQEEDREVKARHMTDESREVQESNKKRTIYMEFADPNTTPPQPQPQPQQSVSIYLSISTL